MASSSSSSNPISEMMNFTNIDSFDTTKRLAGIDLLYEDEDEDVFLKGYSEPIERDPIIAKYQHNPLRLSLIKKDFTMSLFLLPTARSKAVIPIGCTQNFSMVISQRDNGVYNLYCLYHQSLSKLMSPSEYLIAHSTTAGYHVPWTKWLQDIHDFGAIGYFKNHVVLACDHMGISGVTIMQMPDFKINLANNELVTRTHVKTLFSFLNLSFLVLVYTHQDALYLFILTAQNYKPRKFIEIPLLKKYTNFYLTDENYFYMITDHQITSYLISYNPTTSAFTFEKQKNSIKIPSDVIRSIKFYPNILLIICEHRVKLIDIGKQISRWIDVGLYILDVTLLDLETRLFVCHDRTNGLYFFDEQGMIVCYSNTEICNIFNQFNYPCPSVTKPYQSIVYFKNPDNFELGYLLPNGSFLRFIFHFHL